MNFKLLLSLVVFCVYLGLLAFVTEVSVRENIVDDCNNLGKFISSDVVYLCFRENK